MGVNLDTIGGRGVPRFVIVLCAAAFVAAFGATESSVAATTSDSSANSAAQCSGPCPIVIFGLGNTSGLVEVRTLYMAPRPDEVETCSVTPGASCPVQIDEFSGGAVLKPLSPGFRGWSECPGIVNPVERTCSIPAGSAGSTCAAFTHAPTDPVPPSACPPPYVQLYKKGDGKGTVTAQGSGQTVTCTATCPSAVWTTFAANAQVTLTAVANEGSFVRWDGCPSATGNVCTIQSLTTVAMVCAVFVSATPVNDLNCPARTPTTPPPPPPPPPAGPPNTRISSGPSATRATRSRRATFRFTSTQARSSFLCRIDSKPWLPCRSGKTYTNLKPGVHTFRVRAMNSAGKLDPTPAARRWRIRR